MRVLALTKIFPNRAEPFSSPFNRQQFGALSKQCELEILATIPWFPWARAFARWSQAGRLAKVPKEDLIDGLVVRHPRFFYVPKAGRGLSGPLYAASLAATALRYEGRVDLVVGSWAYPDGFAAVVLAGLLGVPSVVKVHGSDLNVVAKMPGPRRCLEWALPRADRIVAVSRPLRDAAVSLGARPDRVDIVPNGIDRELFKPRCRLAARRALGLPLEGAIVLYVGNIEAHKGVLDLVRAATPVAKRSGASLVLVGSGTQTNRCRALADDLRIPIRFVGPRPHEEVPTWLSACDVLALPSWNEGTPNVLLEALASGRRVVATRVGGTPDVVRSETLGSLVAPRDPRALAAAVEAALDTPYDPVAVAEELNAPDWTESARLLRESFRAALASRAREAA